MNELFRREALAHRRGQWLGGVQLLRPPSLTLLTVFALAAALAAAAWLGLGHYTRKARVSGYLVPDAGVIRLMPPEPATVLERRVREGQAVRRDDVLFVLSVDRATLGGDTQAAVRRSLVVRERSLRGTAEQRVRLLAEQREALARRLGDMRGESAQLDAEAGLQRQRLALAEASLQRLDKLRGDNFVSPAQVQSKTEEVLGLRAQVQAIERQRAAQRREVDGLAAQLRELPLREQVQQGEIERGLAQLAQEAAESEARGRLVVRAPQDGTVSALLAEAGQSVGPGAALASLVPAHSQLQAELFAPSSAVGFVQPGQTVWLRYQAYPYQKFGHHAGRVLRVSRTPLQTAELARLPLPGTLTGAAPGAGGEPLYRITVALDEQAVLAYGRPQPLSAGMQLDADVLLDRRRLVEWMFEPLFGLTGRV
ncbi:MAG TPA: HlyD family efflux transporter periplasmic adaptor subunit [Ideonella sp.]|nr:HlyD family efflux transporter periplasmic adaptor subunit [Ideonella sp.]